MIGSKAKSHANFSNLISYQLHLDKCSEFRTYNIFAERPEGIAREMHKTFRTANSGRPKNQQITTPTYHISFSWPDEDQPTSDQMLAVGEDFIKHMNLDDYQAVIAVHHDTDHRHIHVVANRVHPTGGPLWEEWKWRDTSEGRECEATHHQRVETFERAMEQEFGWRVDKGRHAGEWDKTFDGHTPKLWEVKKGKDKEAIAAEAGYEIKRADFRTPKLKADELKEQLFKAKTFAQFDDILAKDDLWLEKRGQGVVITDGFDSVPGSHVSRAFSRGKLEDRFGQDFETYSSGREDGIYRHVGDRMVTKALAIQVIADLEQTRGLRKQELRQVEMAIEDLDTSPEMENIRREITAGFEEAYQHSAACYQRYIAYADHNGSYQAYEQISENPNYFGELKNEAALIALTDQLRKFEEKSFQANNYIKSIITNGKKQQLADEKENIRGSYLDLTSQVAKIKRQANQTMAKMLAETEEGRDLLKLNRNIRKNVRLVQQIITLHRSLNRLSKGSGSKFSQKLMKSIGIPGTAIALNSIKVCSKILLQTPENNKIHDISR